MSFYDKLAKEYNTTYHEMKDMLNCCANWDDYDVVDDDVERYLLCDR